MKWLTLFCLLACPTLAYGQLKKSLPGSLVIAEQDFTPPKTNREEIVNGIGPDAVQQLSAKLMQFQGKFDPQTLEKLLAELKKNPGMSQQDLLKSIAGQQSGLTPEQLSKFMPMLNDPDFLNKLKGMSGGPDFDGKLPNDKFADLLKSLNKDGGNFKLPNVQGPDISNLSKVKLPEMTPPKITMPDMTMPKMGQMPNMPKGNLPNMPNMSPAALRMMQMWEGNIGPLSDSPAMKDLITNVFKSSLNADGMPSGFFDFMEKNNYSGKGFGDWMGSSSGSSWSFPSWLGGGGGGSGGGSSWNFGWGGGSTPNTPDLNAPSVGDGSWWSVVLFVVAAGGGLVLWWLWPRLMAGRQPLAENLTPLVAPIDPNAIIDRETLVRIFEEMSVRLCGDDAKMWTYTTIGEALREYVANNPNDADRLAMLYAIARYTPAAEPMAPQNLGEARTHVGTIAGASQV